VTTADFLAALAESGVAVEADGDELRCRAARGVLAPELLAKIKVAKRDLLTLLRDRRFLDAALSVALRRNNERLRPLNPGLADTVEATARERHSAGDLQDLRDLLKTIDRCVANAKARLGTA
jgi:hypothetical protein